MLFSTQIVNIYGVSDVKRLILGYGCLQACYYSGAVVWGLSLLHNFIQQSLFLGSAQVQILLALCRRFAMVRVSDNGPVRK